MADKCEAAVGVDPDNETRVIMCERLAVPPFPIMEGERFKLCKQCRHRLELCAVATGDLESLYGIPKIGKED